MNTPTRMATGQVQIVVEDALSAATAAAWDRLVDATAGTDVTQLTAWARLRARVGFRAVHVLARHNGRLVGGAQILLRRVPPLGTAGYLPYGPVIGADCDPIVRDTVGELLADGLARLGRSRLRALFVQPPEGEQDTVTRLRARGFRLSGLEIAPAGSVRIDLHEDLTVIRSRFGKRLRSWTNRWAAHGVTVRRGDARDIPLLTDLMSLTARHQGFPALPADYVAALYAELAAAGHAVLFVGEVAGVPVAADLMTGCAGMLRGRLSGFDRCGPGRQLSVPAAIRWEMIAWAKAQGYRWFDFGGLQSSTLDVVLAGEAVPSSAIAEADQPKLTFGGMPYRYPAAVELIRPMPARFAFDVVLRSDAGRRLLAFEKDRLRGARGAR
jgi:lipid II:glycine glycyltransferase (peptidoglycan interpeptide bridge formation enzyme)